MSEVDRIFAEYVADHRAGKKAAPLEYLERVSGLEQHELAALIEGYLERSPQRWNAEAFAGSSSERLVTKLEPLLEGESLWRYVLPELRQKAEIKRADLVTRLAQALGVGDRESKVRDYYHRMETGGLRPEGVSQRVLEELGKIVGATAESLRRAGQGLGAAGGGRAQIDAIFARTAGAPAPGARNDEGPMQMEPSEAEHDEVDRLFLDG